MEIVFPIDGDMLHARDGVVAGDGLQVEVVVTAEPGSLRLPFGRECIAQLGQIEPVGLIKKIEMDLCSICSMQPPQKGQVGVVKNAFVYSLVLMDVAKEPDIIIYR